MDNKASAPPPYPGADPSYPAPPPGYTQAEFQQGGANYPPQQPGPPPNNMYPNLPPGQPAYPAYQPSYNPQQQPGNKVPQQGPQGPTIMTQPAPVTIITMTHLGPYPASMTCPKCHNQIVTKTNPAPGILTWLICGGLLIFGCWFGCCLIPFCVPECQDMEHTCPNCRACVGIYKRI